MVISDVSPLLELFDRLSKLGGVLRRVIVGALLDSDIYAKLMQGKSPIYSLFLKIFTFAIPKRTSVVCIYSITTATLNPWDLSCFLC